MLNFSSNGQVSMLVQTETFKKLLNKTAPLTIPFNTRKLHFKKPFGISEKSPESDKNVFINLFLNGEKRKITSIHVEFNYDENKAYYQKSFKQQGVGGYLKIGNFYVIEYGAENDTIYESSPSGDVPFMEKLFVFNIKGEILDTLDFFGNVTLENDLIHSYIALDKTITVFNYEINKNSYHIKNGILFKKDNATHLTKLNVTKYKVDETSGKFIIKEHKSFNLLKSLNFYKNENLPPDDPMRKL